MQIIYHTNNDNKVGKLRHYGLVVLLGLGYSGFPVFTRVRRYFINLLPYPFQLCCRPRLKGELEHREKVSRLEGSMS